LWLNSIKISSPTRVTFPNLVTQRQAFLSRESTGPIVPPSKVTQGHWSQHGSTGYLWLPVFDP